MRRLTVLILLLLVPFLAVAPGLVRASSSRPGASVHTPAPEHTAAPKKCATKKGKGKTKKCKATAKKPTPTPTPKPKKKKTPKPAATPVRVPPRTATPTATSTATPTSTPTLTPTPAPATARIAVHSDIPPNYVAAFIVCGLPTGVTASFDENPVTSQTDYVSPSGGSAHAILTLTVDPAVPASAYGLEVWAYYETPAGLTTTSPPGGNVTPHAILLTVDAAHQASVKAVDAVAASGFQNCSPVPTTFRPTPLPTISPSQVQVTSSVSNPSPAPGETVVVSAQIMAAGVPVPNVQVHFAYYGPSPIPGCDAITNRDGIAVCTQVNSNPLHGYSVLIQVTFSYNGVTYTSYTSYSM